MVLDEVITQLDVHRRDMFSRRVCFLSCTLTGSNEFLTLGTRIVRSHPFIYLMTVNDNDYQLRLNWFDGLWRIGMLIC